MNLEYKRDLNHNYLILSAKQQGRENYQSKMMERNTVSGILPCTVHYVEDSVKYYYDISSKQPLKCAFSIRKMNYQLVCGMFRQIEQIFLQLGNYLLDSSRILLDVNYIYWDVEEEKISLIFYPQKEKEEGIVQRFAEELLNLVDYADKKAVDAAYWFYEKAAGENFTLSEVFAYFRDLQPEERGDYRNDDADRFKDTNTDDYTDNDADGDQYYDAYDDVIENETDERVRAFKRFLPLILCLFIFLAAGYILTHYKLTVNEMLAGCGFLAMIPAAFLVHLIKKWQKRITERRSKETGENSLCRKEQMPEQYKEVETVPEARECKGGNEPETEAVYGETTYFGAQGWQQERCLEGRYKGKQILICIDKTPFIIGKLQGAVSYVLSDVTVSRMHAQFIEKDGKLFLQDINSKNGTYKNEVEIRAQETAEVYPGDEIRFGRLRFTYH